MPKKTTRQTKPSATATASFGGVIYAPQLVVTIGQCIDDLELIAQCAEPDE